MNLDQKSQNGSQSTQQKAAFAAPIAVSRPSVFNYLNYRVFLKEFYLFKKAESRGYSYAVFSQRAGLKSPNYLKLVTEGARNVTADNILSFALALGLSELETIYWENLVAFNQSKTDQQRRHYFVKLVRSPLPAGFKDDAVVREIRDEWDYLSAWYPAAIRELVLRDDFDERPATIARMLRDKISADQAREALGLLLRLRFLVRDASGRLRQAEKTVRYFNERDLASLPVRQFHQSTGQLALESLESDPPEARDFGGLTLSVHRAAIPDLKRRMAGFRKSVLEEFGGAQGDGCVFQINFQVVPLTGASGSERPTQSDYKKEK